MSDAALRGVAHTERAWPPWAPALSKGGPLDADAAMNAEGRLFVPGVWISLAILMGACVGFLLATRAWALQEPKQKGDGPNPKGHQILQVTIRENLSTLDLVALIWCFLPFIVPGGFAVWWICSQSFFPLYGLSLALFCVVLNEVFLKGYFKQPRPIESAATSWGFPSGHVLNAFALMAWLFLEVAIPGDHRVPMQWNTVLILSAVFAPVPWARYHNGDHSLQQVTWSVFLGGALGVAAFVNRRLCFPFIEVPWD